MGSQKWDKGNEAKRSRRQYTGPPTGSLWQVTQLEGEAAMHSHIHGEECYLFLKIVLTSPFWTGCVCLGLQIQ